MTTHHMTSLDKWMILQHWLISDARLTRSAIVVLGRLLQHRNPKTGRCDPALVTLARDLRISRKSVQTAVNELEEHAAIIVNRRSRGSRNSYVIMHPDTTIRAKRDDKGGKLGVPYEEAGSTGYRKHGSREKIKENIKKRNDQNKAADISRNIPNEHNQADEGTIEKHRRQAEQSFHNKITTWLRDNASDDELYRNLDPAIIKREFDRVQRQEITEPAALEHIYESLLPHASPTLPANKDDRNKRL